MTVLVVPTFDDPSYTEHSTFEGTLYGLQFDFNQRCAAWYLSIADVDGVDIYNGIKLICGFPLLRKCADPRRPPGELVVLSSTGDRSPPSRGDLDQATGRCALLYISSDWVKQIAAGNAASLVTQLNANTQTSAFSTYGEQ